MENRMCFECLQRQIQSDFSDKLIFSYGLSDSALPFGSSAIVQLTHMESASLPKKRSTQPTSDVMESSPSNTSGVQMAQYTNTNFNT
ncbi:unnamed protein product [Ilex paraguariensis]|uniref:Uncharacterized protein n=1 Tax=Ilex paraguariensis TaxID=185542 RepID=A0ABC8UP96_9AQUA